MMTRRHLTGRSLVLLLLVAINSVHLVAQSQSAAQSNTQPPVLSPSANQPLLRFEVASIRPHRNAGDEPSDRRMLPGGRFIATATTVRTLIRVAFGADDDRIFGAPGWIDDETFDIDATTVNRAEITTPQQFQQVILSLLEDRFGFKFHRGQKEGPVYWLEVDKSGKLGPAIKPGSPNSQPNISTNSDGQKTVMAASGMSMADIASALSRQAGRLTEDHTNLEGNFDLLLEWSPAESPDATNPPLFTAIKEQLGLKLQPAKGAIETVVIDRITHPSAN
ncbi:MAG TPA: TIGR03435 family protein [Terracidiphilus sp.]